MRWLPPGPSPADRAAHRRGLEDEDAAREWDAVPWEQAGGPNECRHGYAAGIPCPRCGPSLADRIKKRLNQRSKK